MMMKYLKGFRKAMEIFDNDLNANNLDKSSYDLRSENDEDSFVYSYPLSRHLVSTSSCNSPFLLDYRFC